MSGEIDIKTINLNVPRKDRVRVMVGQPTWIPTDWGKQESLFSFKNEEKPRLWLEAFLQKANQKSCDLVLLPELSIPESLIFTITAWSKQTGIMVKAGHFNAQAGYKSFEALIPVLKP